MRQVIGAVVACLAVVGASACSSATAPPAEGNAVVMYGSVNKSIFGNGGRPEATKYGGTVLDGTNSVGEEVSRTSVSCTVKKSGDAFSVVAHIENAAVSLDVASADITACSKGTAPDGCASMTFFVQGRPDSDQSVDDKNNPAPTCIVNTTQANTMFVVEPGSIFASYRCQNVRSPTNPGTQLDAQGFFLFTGCNR